MFSLLDRSRISFWVGVAWIVFQVLTPIIGVPHGVLLSGHVFFAFNFIFINFPIEVDNDYLGATIDGLLIVGTTASLGYLVVNYQEVIARSPSASIASHEVVLGVIGILIVFEGTRRILGIMFPIIGMLLLGYLVLPLRFTPTVIPPTPTVSLNQAVSKLYLSTGGILEVPTLVMARYVFLFIFMAAFLIESGAVSHFYNMATSLTGRMAGGGAKTAVATSALVGSINGSAVANVVTTGSITIPLMKDTGYANDEAAAIESLASTGGQILPPVMGTAAFIMAHVAGIPYPHIVLAALLPAVLFYVGVYSVVHFLGKKHGLGSLPDDEIPPVRSSFKRGFWLFIPFVVIIYTLLLWPYNVQYVALVGALSAGIIVFVSPEIGLSYDEFVEVLRKTPTMTVKATAPSALAGIVLGLLSLTMLDLRLTSAITGLGTEAVVATAIAVAITCIILGMGMPTSGAYIVAAAIAIPGLVALDIVPMAAHLFGLYFAVISMITPPIAIAVFAATGVANSKIVPTAIKAFLYGIPAYVIPFAFLFNRNLLLGVGDLWMGLVWFFPASVGIIAIAGGITGYFVSEITLIERPILVVGGMMVMFPALSKYAVFVGLTLILSVSAYRIVEARSGRVRILDRIV